MCRYQLGFPLYCTASSFIARRPELKTRFNRVYDYQRALQEDPAIIEPWFRLYANMYAKYGLTDSDVYGISEATINGFIATTETAVHELAHFVVGKDPRQINAIANHIIKTGRVNQDFVARHTNFRRGNTDIGYGLRPEHPLEQKAANAKDPGGSTLGLKRAGGARKENAGQVQLNLTGKDQPRR